MRVLLNEIELVRGRACCEAPIELKIEGRKDVQVSTLLRSETARVFDRGNFQTRVRFRAKQEHGTLEAAEVYAIEHMARVGKTQGTLRIELEDATGAVFEMTDASLRALECQSEGTLTHHRYEIIGSEMRKVNIEEKTSDE